MAAKKFPLEGSARHLHITSQDLQALFGKDYKLHYKRELSQPGEYLCEERVRLEGPRGAIDRVSILGPERAATQIEISLTDARALGVEAPIRESGDIKGSAPIRLVGPAGTLELSEGAIVAKRHVHLSPADAERFGVSNKQIVRVKVEGPRALVFDEVVVRVAPSFATAMHLDFDEMNAAALSGEVYGEIVD